MNVRNALFLFALLATSAGGRLPSVAVAPNPSQTWQMVGQIGGPTNAVVVQGNYAYVGIGLRLIVLDVSNPAAPMEVGSTTPFPYFVEDVTVSGTQAYVANGYGGLRVVDISNPANPAEIGAWDSPGYARGVALAGSTVYLADGPYGLWAVDISNPANPSKIGSAYAMNYVFDVAVANNHAYIAAAGAGLLIADVSNPTDLIEVGSLDTPGYAYGVAVAGNMAYVADGWEGVQLVNVTSPGQAVEVSSYKTAGWAFGIAISGTRVYVADAFDGLKVLDVSDIGHPIGLGGYEPTYGNAASVTVAGSMAYMADRNWGLRLVNVFDPANLVEVSSFKSMASVEAVEVVGNYAYVVSSGIGLRVADVTDPTHPSWLGATDIVNPNGWRDIQTVLVVGSYAYVGVGNQLFVADISDPTHPFWTESIQMKGLVVDMTIAGGIAYIADEGGLQLVDLSAPGHPALLGRIELGTRSVDVSGTLAYIADAISGFNIIDVSDPNIPTRIGGSSALGDPFDVSVVGKWAYVLDRGGVSVVDVSNPANPQEVSHLQTFNPRSIKVSGSTAYIADGMRGLSVVDVSDPIHPIYAANFDTPGYSLGLTLANNRVFIADGQNGLVILEKVPVSSAFTAKSEYPDGQPAPAVQIDTGFEGLYSHLPGLEQILPEAVTGLSLKPIHPVDPSLEPSHEGVSPNIGTNTCVVISPADSGAGTLRQCLVTVASGDTITFDPTIFPPASPATISLSSALPLITQGNITIDGSNAGVILDGSALIGAVYGGPDGLRILSNGNIVKGLQIYSFPSDGVEIHGDENTIGGDRSQGDGPVGQGNVLSGNGCAGMNIQTDNNLVDGNLIGTDVTGTHEFGNGCHGVGISGSGNIIGQADPRYRNVSSGNVEDGIAMGPGANNNSIAGNYVGTDIIGAASLGNDGNGISMNNGAFNNVVQGNLASGNKLSGIQICGWGSDFNTITGNLVGTDASGMQAIPNPHGVIVGCSAAFNRIGGTAPGEANLISGNSGLGVSVNEQGQGNLVLGNLIGTTISGSVALGNNVGVYVATSDAETMIGGASQAESNLISGNSNDGIDIIGDSNFVIGNRIGTNASSTGTVPNGVHGISVVGERNMFQGNLITHNIVGHGVLVRTWSYNTIRRNSIYNNGGKGIYLIDGGNAMLPAPTIVSVTPRSVSGTTCPGCTVEVFSDAEDEGRFYEDTTIADTVGNWLLITGHSLSGPHVTATATDQNGNTSEFSLPQIVWKWLYLPIIKR